VRKRVCLAIVALMGVDLLCAATSPDAGLGTLVIFIALGFLLVVALTWEDFGTGSGDYGGGGASYGSGAGGFGDGGDGGDGGG